MDADIQGSFGCWKRSRGSPQDQKRSQMNPFGDSTPIKITKLEAARRQLVTAIRIYFANGDPVSIHTLAAAAFGILDDLDNHGASTGTIFDQIATRITPEYVDSFREALRRPQNFFKHADRDPENILEFRPGSAGVIIWAACEKYCELTKEELLETAAFHRWILIRNLALGRFYLRSDRRFDLSKRSSPARLA